MNRNIGFHYIKLNKESPWRVAYWDGQYWQISPLGKKYSEEEVYIAEESK